jgi:hypothetical protein
MKNLKIAEITNEANRLLHLANEDKSISKWENADPIEKAMLVKRVQYRIANPEVTAEDEYNEWVKTQKEEITLEYSDLPELNRKKDELFIAIVDALK